MAPFVFFMVVALIMLAIVRLILSSDYLPHDLASWPGYILVLALIAGSVWIPRFVFFVFKDQWGKPALRIICERSQQAECRAFVAELVAAIENPVVGLEPDQAMAPVDLPADRGVTVGKSNWRWKLSLLMGGLAAGLPLWQSFMHGIGPFAFFLIFLLSFGGLVIGAWSFLQKERSRYWALCGILLSLIPPFFYS